MTGDQQGQTYVVDGATIHCSAGTSNGTLHLPSGHNFDTNGKATLNISDSQSMTNIGSMGQCKNQKKKTCVPTPAAQWQNGKSTVAIAGIPALLNTSTIPCGHGGTISIVADGQ